MIGRSWKGEHGWDWFDGCTQIFYAALQHELDFFAFG